MAKGYPDFFGYSVFPFLGVYQSQVQQIDVLAAFATGDIFSVTGKIIIRGGRVRCLYVPATMRFQYYEIIVDGVVVQTLYPQTMVQSNLTNFEDNIMIIREYREIQGYTTVVLTSEISVLESFILRAISTGANILGIAGELYYCNVQ